jgi:hypothetical protein
VAVVLLELQLPGLVRGATIVRRMVPAGRHGGGGDGELGR